MKTTFHYLFLASTAAATNAPTAAPTALVVPTVPAIATALTVDMYSDASCTVANDASKFSGTGVAATGDLDRGSRTWKTNECLVLSTSLSMKMDTLCLTGASCTADVSYDHAFYATADCTGSAVSGFGGTAIPYACTAVAASSTSGAVAQYKKVTRFIPTQDSLIAGLYNDAACATSTTPFFITSNAGSGTCSKIYTLGQPGYESRVTLMNVNKGLIGVELFAQHAPTTSNDPQLTCAAHLRALRVEVTQGVCQKLDATSAGTLAALGACASTNCYTYAFTQADLFPAAATMTTTASVTILFAAISSLALLMQ